jgi:hypothetical protein
VLCHGTFLLSDSTVCCAKYNGRNTILLKHASMVPQCGIAMEELFKEAQAPEGLYTNLLISGRRSTFSE